MNQTNLVQKPKGKLSLWRSYSVRFERIRKSFCVSVIWKKISPGCFFWRDEARSHPRASRVPPPPLKHIQHHSNMLPRSLRRELNSAPTMQRLPSEDGLVLSRIFSYIFFYVDNSAWNRAFTADKLSIYVPIYMYIYIYLYMYTQRNIFQIILSQTQIRLYLTCTD